jgi:hypothetical protein
MLELQGIAEDSQDNARGHGDKDINQRKQYAGLDVSHGFQKMFDTRTEHKNRPSIVHALSGGSAAGPWTHRGSVYRRKIFSSLPWRGSSICPSGKTITFYTRGGETVKQ